MAPALDKRGPAAYTNLVNTKRLFWFVLFGGLFGAFLTSWLAPKAIAWYFDPPVNIGVNCKEATQWSMAKLQTAQFIGMCAGCIFGGVFFATFRKKKSDPVLTNREPF